MIKAKSANLQASNSWDTYWQGISKGGALNSDGISHPAIREFWISLFEGAKQDYVHPKVLDVASGNGAVVEFALAVLSSEKSEIVALDASAAAIASINKRLPAVKGIVSDACSIPIETASFDMVSSQFGLEYAGRNAIVEAARLVAKSGQLAVLLHIHNGSIYKECQQSFEAIKRLRKCQFIPLTTSMFDAGFKAVQGIKSESYSKAAKEYAPAVRELEAIMKAYGRGVASNTISGLYADVRQMHQRIQRYDPVDVFNWLKKMDSEIDAYSDRMSSMLKASVNESDFRQINSELVSLDFSIESAKMFFVPELELPLAWALVARKLP